MRVRYIHSIGILLFVAASACGGVASDGPSSEGTARLSLDAEATSSQQGASDSEKPLVAVEAVGSEGSTVAVSTPERFRELVDSVEFVPVSGGESEPTVVEMSERRLGNGESLRRELPSRGVYDIAIHLDSRGAEETRPELPDGGLPEFEFTSRELRVDEEAGEPTEGDPVPFPADQTSWKWASTSTEKGERSDNGDPVPLPAAPEADSSEEESTGARADNGDPVPLPADDSLEARNRPYPPDEDEEDSSDPEPEVFQTQAGALVVIPNVDLATHRLAGLLTIETLPPTWNAPLP